LHGLSQNLARTHRVRNSAGISKVRE